MALKWITANYRVSKCGQTSEQSENKTVKEHLRPRYEERHYGGQQEKV